LEIDSRAGAAIERSSENQWSPPAFWSFPVLQSLSTPGVIRQSCTFAAGLLFLLSFCCLNEDFVVSRFSLPRVCLPRRYRPISNASVTSTSDRRRSS
ncbi:MAG TPA: hypothetical protein VNQ76_20395, partial [Planctomicrobium sp.]|nr:hypothetical protein [Planctomicrobium sp.]